jgi:UDP-glucuronate decarboxylase
MKFLLTGVAGFLGSHLADSLLEDGHEVTGVDNFYTGNIENLTHLRDFQRFELVQQDITLPFDIEADFILNFACPASPIHYQKNPVQTIKTSVLGVTNLLEMATRQNIPLLQASTSEVYGDPQVSPQPETYWGNVNPIGVRSCYDEGKRVAETLMFDFHREFGTRIKIARIFNTYGPRMQIEDGRVVSNFIVSALRGNPITIYGEGNQTRSFCYVSDLIKGIKLLVSNDNPELKLVNLGNTEEFSMLELSELILRLTNSSSTIIKKSLPLDDPKSRRPDITLAEEQLRWKPTVALQEGLQATIKYFESIV